MIVLLDVIDNCVNSDRLHIEVVVDKKNGLVKVFNRLPQHFVDSKTTQEFQRRLQNCAKDAASENAIDWQLMYSK